MTASQREGGAVIRDGRGNLLAADVDALVNTVNTVGVAGKGIALQFRQAYPENFRSYERAAKRGQIKPGQMYVWETGQLNRPHYIINFPTKRHWRGRSRIADIKVGLQDLSRTIAELRLSSIAIPPLGCGNGGLDWKEVRPLIVAALNSLAVDAVLYPPSGAPAAEDMPVRSKKPRMTLGRAALLILMKNYRESDWFRLSALEVQKLAYFLQALGEPLNLKFVKSNYGPYAEALNHVLITIEGHYTRGYGDRSKEPEIRVLGGAYQLAENFLESNPATMNRLRTVAELLDGWETPYSLELLATTHWALTQVEPPLRTRTDVCMYVASWTPRKARLFKPAQVNRAIDHLAEQEILALPATFSSKEPGLSSLRNVICVDSSED